MPDPEEKIEVQMAPDWKPPDAGAEPQPLSGEAEEPPLEAQEGEPPEKWWTEIEDEEGLKAHERAKPWLDEAEDKARRNVYTQLKPLAEQQRNSLQQLAAQGGRVAKDIERASRDGILDVDLLEKYEGFAASVSGAYFHLGRYDGAKGFVLELSQALDDKTLLEDFQPRIEILEQGGNDERLFPDLLKRLAKASAGKESETSEKKGYEKGLADGRKAATEEIRARQRDGQGPDLVRKQPGGGTVLSLERYKGMTGEERMKLTPAQIDAMTAALANQSQRGL